MGLNNIRNNEKGVSPVIAIILMVAITVVLASVLYVWVMSLADVQKEPDRFPTIEVTLKHGNNDGDTLLIKHINGDPLDWSKYKLIMTNESDASNSAVVLDLSSLGQITAGESSTLTESAQPGFSDIDYRKGKSYQLEIYNLQKNERVLNRDNVICQ